MIKSVIDFPANSASLNSERGNSSKTSSRDDLSTLLTPPYRSSAHFLAFCKSVSERTERIISSDYYTPLFCHTGEDYLRFSLLWAFLMLSKQFINLI